MKHCTQCGHLLGLGRFCTNCGAPVAPRVDPLSDPIELVEAAAPRAPEDIPAAPAAPAEGWQDNTAERRPASAAPPPVVPADPAPSRVPPVAGEPPPPPRFPLFADEIAPAAPVAGAPVLTQASPAPVVAEPETEWDDDEDWDDEEWEERRPRALWILGAVVLLAALVAGAWFLGQQIGGDDDDKAEDPAASGEPEPGGGTERVDHTADASAEAPATAPPGEDVDGVTTSYDASNMLDGVPETAWRMEGDASGLKLVFTFPEKTRITEVGLINGYAKKARDGGKVLDWYEGHRRIQSVTWTFSGGRTVRQDLADGREIQTIEVEPVEVTKVVLKIVATTQPGIGASRRDMTAISDVLFAEN